MFHAMKLGRVASPLPVAGVPTLDAHPIMQAVAPDKLDRTQLPFHPGMDRNDQIGDCTCVALANAIRAQAALAGYQVDIPTDKVVALYSTVGGYPQKDDGVVEVDLLTYQAQHGFDVGGPAAYVGLWANIPVDNLNLLRLVTARMGCAYLGINLAVADQHGGGVWDTDTPAAYGDPTPGSWGGHAVLAWSYDGIEDSSVWYLATWGYLQRATTRWMKSRLEEAHVIYHPQMLGPTGRNPEGFDREQLAADVARFRPYA